MKKNIAINDETLIIDILLDRFERDKSLQEIREDYEDLVLMIARERAANGEGSRRLAALDVLTRFQLKLVLESSLRLRTRRRTQWSQRSNEPLMAAWINHVQAAVGMAS